MDWISEFSEPKTAWKVSGPEFTPYSNIFYAV